MKYKTFIFDLDGTLIDTENAVLKTWQYTLNEYGYNASMEKIRVVLGVTTEIGLQRLGVKADDNYGSNWQKNYEKFAKDCDYFTGAKEMLMKLKSLGCILGAVSSRCKKEYEMYFNNFDFDILFDYVILEEDTIKHKPEPEPLLKFLEISNSNPKESIYIGDMPSDVQCANNAGITSAFVKWNGSNVDAIDADFVFKSTSEVIDLAL
mgnify:CR=1 FL=1